MHLSPQNTSSKKVEIYQHISLCSSVDVLGCAAAGICACVHHWLNFGFCCALYPSKGIMQNIILQVTTVKLPLSAIFRLQHSMLMETLFTRFECFCQCTVIIIITDFFVQDNYFGLTLSSTLSILVPDLSFDLQLQTHNLHSSWHWDFI